MDMDDTTVLVTGGTDGLGRAVAAAFADAGARVVVGARDADDLDATVEELGDEVRGLRTDVRDEYDLERLAETAARFGPAGVGVVVPCAAVYHGDYGETPLPEQSYAGFDDTVRTNARGVFATVRESLPHMPADGQVVVPTEGVARESRPGFGAYAVSKAAAEAVVRGFAADCEQAVGAVDPGPVATDLSGGEGRDPGEAAAMVRWAATELDPDTLDGGVVTVDEWDAATT